MIVAWHEVPGTAPPQKSRPVGYGMIRAGVRVDLKIGGEEISNAVSLSRMEMIPKCLPRRVSTVPKGTRRTFRREIIVGQLRPIIPHPTGRCFGGTLFPGTSCQATIMLSLRDKSHSPWKHGWGLALS